jgi:hypothetical protein
MTAPKPLTGYLPIKEACCRFNRSHRQLNRDRVKAMNLRDSKVTAQFKLQLANGEILAGENLTIEQIPKLRDKGSNPAWYVNELWMEEMYGRKDDPATERPPLTSSDAPNPHKPAEEGSQPTDAVRPTGHIESLTDQLERERQQNAMLVDQLRIKDEQIRQANTRAEESHELMSQLHHLLKNMQDRLLPQLEEARHASADVIPLPSADRSTGFRRRDDAITDAKSIKTNRAKKGSRRPKTTSAATIKSGAKQKPRSQSGKRSEASPKMTRLNTWFSTFFPRK